MYGNYSQCVLVTGYYKNIESARALLNVSSKIIPQYKMNLMIIINKKFKTNHITSV